MTRTLILAGVGTLLLTGYAVSQSMIESAVSAAGGSAAGVAGKKVSEGLDSVFGKVGTITKAAASTGTKKDERVRLAAPIPPLPAVGGAEGAPAGNPTAPAAVARPVARRAAINPGKSGKPVAAVESAPMPAEAPVATPATPPPPPRNLNDLSSGNSREEVLGKWGKPAGRLTTSNDEGHVEVYKYPEGSVKIVNGKVTEIRPRQ